MDVSRDDRAEGYASPRQILTKSEGLQKLSFGNKLLRGNGYVPRRHPLSQWAVMGKLRTHWRLLRWPLEHRSYEVLWSSQILLLDRQQLQTL